MSVEENAALIESVESMTATVAGKMGEIDLKVDAAVNSVPQAIKDNFTQKEVSIDTVNGDDSSANGPFKTIGAAVRSVPDGGFVKISFPYSSVDNIFDFTEAVNIGSRVVILIGGYAGMESSGLKPAVIKALAGFNESLNRSYYRGRFSGDPGGRVYLLNIKLMLPRITAGSSVDHSVAGSFLSGGITVTTHHYSLSAPHIYYADGDTSPLYFLRSSARDGKANMQDLTISYTHIQTVLGAPIIDLQYSTGTIRFAYYGAEVSDKDGAAMTYRELFTGLSYGDHGYATNVVASSNILKQPA